VLICRVSVGCGNATYRNDDVAILVPVARPRAISTVLSSGTLSGTRVAQPVPVWRAKPADSNDATSSRRLLQLPTNPQRRFCQWQIVRSVVGGSFIA